ncbi:MAG: hypothetical protein ABJZ55_01520 [Fuerstiella sp.]
MKILSLNCNHCGAPLDVPAKAKFVTCGFCDSRLAIQHSGSTYSTEVMQQLVQKTAAIQDDVLELKRRAAVSDLDLNWERDKTKFIVKGKNGSESLPSIFGIVFGGVFGTIFVGIALVVFAPFGIFALLIVAANFFSHCSKYSGYQGALSRYQSERRWLMSDRWASEGSPRHSQRGR